MNNKEQKPLWIELVALILKKRNITLVNDDSVTITKNMTISELATKYVTTHKLPLNVVKKINQVRLWKRIYLPFELFGLCGKKATNCFLNLDDKRIIQWQFKFLNIQKPLRSYFNA